MEQEQFGAIMPYITEDLVEMFCKAWGQSQTWETVDADGPHEANLLKLDCSAYSACCF